MKPYWLLVFIALPVFAVDAQDTTVWIYPDDGVRIEGTLTRDTRKIEVFSRQIWTCAVHFGAWSAGGKDRVNTSGPECKLDQPEEWDQKPAFVLLTTAPGAGPGPVRISFAPPPPVQSVGWQLRLLYCEVILAFLVASYLFVDAWQLRLMRVRVREARGELKEFRKNLGTLAEAGRPDNQMDSTDPIAAPEYDASLLDRDIDAFNALVDRWGDDPASAKKWRSEDLNDTQNALTVVKRELYSPEANLADLTRRVEIGKQDVTVAMLRSHDENILAVTDAMEDLLKETVRASGLELIAPRIGDRHDPKTETIERNASIAKPGQREGHVATTICRGLRAGTVIVQKAKVEVYVKA